MITKYLDEVFSCDQKQITHSRLAKLWAHNYGKNFKCVSLRDNLWLENRNSNWVPVHDKDSVPTYVASTLRTGFNQYLVHLAHRMADSPNKILVASYIKYITRVLVCLDQKFFVQALVKECAEYVYDKDFIPNSPIARL